MSALRLIDLAVHPQIKGRALITLAPKTVADLRSMVAMLRSIAKTEFASMLEVHILAPTTLHDDTDLESKVRSSINGFRDVAWVNADHLRRPDH
jgi:hypothetical protein